MPVDMKAGFDWKSRNIRQLMDVTVVGILTKNRIGGTIQKKLE